MDLQQAVVMLVILAAFMLGRVSGIMPGQADAAAALLLGAGTGAAAGVLLAAWLWPAAVSRGRAARHAMNQRIVARLRRWADRLDPSATAAGAVAGAEPGNTRPSDVNDGVRVAPQTLSSAPVALMEAARRQAAR